MPTKTLKTRIQLKTGTSKDWGNATGFHPLKGELLIYDEDTAPKLKVGTGSSTDTPADLPFIGPEVSTTGSGNAVTSVAFNSSTGKLDITKGSTFITSSGTAAKAEALTTSAGSATKPVYFSNGKPVAGTYSLNADVPSGAKFTDTTYSEATTSANGLMSSEDKTKLNGIATGANNYAHPTYTAKTSGLYKITVDGTGHVSATTAITKSDITGLGIPAQDTNTAHAHTAGTGLSVSGSGSTSGTTTYSLKQATASEIGGVKVSSVNSSAVTVNGESTTSGRYYPIELNSDGKAIVNVPWTDNNTDTGATSVAVGGSGNAVTTASYDASTRKLTLTKGTTFLTSHQDISGKANLSGDNTFTGTQVLKSPNSSGYSVNAEGYVKGSWGQFTTTGHQTSTSGKVCVLDDAGWIYYRSPAEILTDGGAKTTFTGTAVTSTGPSGTSSTITVPSSTHTHNVSHTPAGSVASASAGTAVTSVSSSISSKCMTLTTSTSSLSHSHTFTGTAATLTTGGPNSTTSVASSTHTHSVTAKGTLS